MSADRRIERVTAMLFAVLALGSTGPAEAANGAPPEPTTGGFDTEARRRTMREMRAVGLAAAH